MAHKVNNLNDILPPEMREAESQPLDEHMDVALVFHNAREVTGKHGVYMRLVCSHPDEDEQFYLATGASQPMEIFKWAKENHQFPFVGRFVKAGKAIILKGLE